MDLKELGKAINQVAEEKGLESDKVLEAIESSIAAAYKKEYGQRGEIVKAKLDLKAGDVKFWQIKTGVDETTVRFIEEGSEEAATPEAVKASEEPLLPRYNSERHIT
ncbi:hypothetical protein BUZ18_12365, partial [Staphylococcus haemolyticus]|uniref:NusA N-terminal domain-containing protein n=1 Tax=Staphylococcus haemolyticus TaxID=1283 RepID=UPI000D402517